MGFKIEIRELLTHRNICVFPGRIRGKKNSSTNLQEQIPCEARGKHLGRMVVSRQPEGRHHGGQRSQKNSKFLNLRALLRQIW